MFRVLECKVDTRKKEEIFFTLDTFLSSHTSHHVITLNPEMAVAAYRDQELRTIINQASLVLPDGMGIVWGSFGKISERVCGMDVFKHLQGKGKMVFLGGEASQTQKAANLCGAVFLDIGEVTCVDGRWSMRPEALALIHDAKPDILFVALGHGKQEKWIASHLPFLPSVKVAVGIGGLFAFLSKDISRAPLCLQRSGLEWVWRLAHEPGRFPRMFRAIFVFPTLVFVDIIKQSFLKRIQ